MSQKYCASVNSRVLVVVLWLTFREAGNTKSDYFQTSVKIKIIIYKRSQLFCHILGKSNKCMLVPVILQERKLRITGLLVFSLFSSCQSPLAKNTGFKQNFPHSLYFSISESQEPYIRNTRFLFYLSALPVDIVTQVKSFNLRGL